MEHRDAHAALQRFLDLEALRRLDVLKVDPAECRLQRRHNINEPFGIGGVDLDVENVDAGEFLEQDRLTFHHRLGRQRADIAQTQNGSAVGDHGDQVAARRQFFSLGRVLFDRGAGRGDTRRIGQGQIALGRQGFGCFDRELPRRGGAVIFECGFTDIHVGVLPVLGLSWACPGGLPPGACRSRVGGV